MINGTDTPTHYTSDDVKNVGENHFRLNLGMGFGLDIVLLYSSSLAFRSYDGNLLDLISAYVGDDNVFYNSNKGDTVTKEALLSAFRQTAALFGFVLTGQLIDRRDDDPAMI